MKKLMMLLPAIVCAISVQAGVVNWAASNLKTPGDLTTALAVGNNVLVQLVYSPDNVIDWTDRKSVV